MAGMLLVMQVLPAHNISGLKWQAILYHPRTCFHLDLCTHHDQAGDQPN